VLAKKKSLLQFGKPNAHLKPEQKELHNNNTKIVRLNNFIADFYCSIKIVSVILTK
jgi:hypothetical protein